MTRHSDYVATPSEADRRSRYQITHLFIFKGSAKTIQSCTGQQVCTSEDSHKKRSEIM